ncbi:MAG: baseplate J/gp47 family protein [Chloroflexi bacterium]|nr:baseplate J/gp47 family protein [Chloroflexota bacterium]
MSETPSLNSEQVSSFSSVPQSSQRPFSVVSVDADDDIASINGKVEVTPDDVVVLALARKARQLRVPLYLRLLHRHGDSLAKDIIIVTGDAIIRSLARSEGFRTFSSLKALDREWARLLRGGKLTWGDVLDAAQLVAMVLGGVGVIGLVAYLAATFLVPSATVVIKPTSQLVSTTMTITARTDASGPNLELAQIPARLVEAALETTARIETSGSRSEPDKPATGRVTFINRSDERVVVPRGTQVSTAAGIVFSTQAEVVLAPTSGSTASVGIVATEPGPLGNVKAMAVDRILDGQLAPRLAIVSEEPTEGGSEKTVKLVTAADQAKLLEKVKDAALPEAIKQLAATKRPEESIYPETVQVRVVDSQFEPREGEAAPVLSVKARVVATGVGFEGPNVNKLVAQKLVTSVSGQGEVQTQSLRIRPLEARSWDKDRVTFNVFGQGRVLPVLNRDDIKEKLTGHSKAEAENYLLKNLQLAAPPVINLYPGWATDLPKFGWRIELQVVAEG